MPKESSIHKIKSEAEAFLDDERFVAGSMRRFQKFIHFWVLVIRSFLRNRCPVRASALAYTTLLALIPLLAVGVGISASLLKNQDKAVSSLIDKLVEEVAPQLGLVQEKNDTEDMRTKTAHAIMEFIGKVNSGALGVTGTLALVLVAISLLANIEKTLNDIWGVTRGRSWFAQLIQYWAAITLGPLLMVLAMGFSLGGNLQSLQEKVYQWSPVLGSWLFGGLAMCMPYLLLIVAFMMIYMLMPNTKVQWKAAFIGAAVGSVLWNLNSQFNMIFASRVVTASKIYGPLGAVPVFLIGLYFSWLIMLFGAQVAYAVQNRRAYLQDKQAESVNQRGREFVALRLMASIGQKFVAGQKPATATELADALDVPTRLVLQIAHTLVAAGLLVEVAGAAVVAVPEVAYDPARPLEKITCHDILNAMRAGQGQELATRDEPSRADVRAQFDRIQDSEREVSARVTVFDLATKTSTTQN